MGTRGTTTIMEYNKPLVTIYRQMDSYPKGHGIDIAKILKNMQVINGFSDHKLPKYVNGMGCLAAYLIKRLKKHIGNIYIVPLDEREGYHYTIYSEPTSSENTPHAYEKILIKIEYNGEILFNGTPKQLLKQYEKH